MLFFFLKIEINYLFHLLLCYLSSTDQMMLNLYIERIKNVINKIFGYFGKKVEMRCSSCFIFLHYCDQMLLIH